MLDKVLTKLIDLDEYVRTKVVTHEQLDHRINQLGTQVDGFVKLHETLDQELVAMRARVERLEDRITRLETKFA